MAYSKVKIASLGYKSCQSNVHLCQEKYFQKNEKKKITAHQVNLFCVHREMRLVVEITLGNYFLNK